MSPFHAEEVLQNGTWTEAVFHRAEVASPFRYDEMVVSPFQAGCGEVHGAQSHVSPFHAAQNGNRTGPQWAGQYLKALVLQLAVCHEEDRPNIHWNLSNQDTNGAEESVIVSEVSSLKEWYLGWEKVSCLESCPNFRSVLIKEVPPYRYVHT